MLPFDIISK